MTRTTDITSFTDLRKNLRVQLDRVRELGRPLFVTTNGQTDAVVLSPAGGVVYAQRSPRDAFIEAGSTPSAA